LCISIDVELGWGIWDKPRDDYHKRCVDREATIIRSLLAQFVQRDISATWAIVGRLLELDERASCSTRHGSQIWFAPELVELIRDAQNQDIGSHSYAHPYFAETPREQLRTDLAAARRVHEQHGLPWASFVFPRNQVAHLDLLRENGIKVYRSTDRGWHMDTRRRLGATIGRVANLFDKLLPIPPQAVTPRAHDGLVEIPSSMLLFAANGMRRAIHPKIVITKARLGLEAARRSGDVFHLWFHPSNFYYKTSRQLALLGTILDIATAMRARGELEIRPMSSFVAQ
jgi:peptidoglycan/xylan/chitin deacetylase (PgdA/CDA1 family)